MKLLLIVLLVMVPALAGAQTMTYEERAALAKDLVWQDRVGIAAQQQATIAQGENPKTCCQTSAQTAMSGASSRSSLCTLTIPPGSTSAPAYVQDASVNRHNARARLAMDVAQNPVLWSQRIAGMVASDTCVTAAITDTALQSYLVRLWDLLALTPELAAVPVQPTPPEEILPGARIPDPKRAVKP